MGRGLHDRKKHNKKSQSVSSSRVKLSRELRKTMTASEKEFWEMVRDRRMFGLKFRRQQDIDGFIVDCYCDSLGLCVEIDGGVHDSEEQREYDKLKDEAFSLRGVKVLRFKNEEIFNEKEDVKDKISVMVLASK